MQKYVKKMDSLIEKFTGKTLEILDVMNNINDFWKEIKSHLSEKENKIKGKIFLNSEDDDNDDNDVDSNNKSNTNLNLNSNYIGNKRELNAKDDFYKNARKIIPLDIASFNHGVTTRNSTKMKTTNYNPAKMTTGNELKDELTENTDKNNKRKKNQSKIHPKFTNDKKRNISKNKRIENMEIRNLIPVKKPLNIVLNNKQTMVSNKNKDLKDIEQILLSENSEKEKTNDEDESKSMKENKGVMNNNENLVNNISTSKETNNLTSGNQINKESQNNEQPNITNENQSKYNDNNEMDINVNSTNKKLSNEKSQNEEKPNNVTNENQMKTINVNDMNRSTLTNKRSLSEDSVNNDQSNNSKEIQCKTSNDNNLNNNTFSNEESQNDEQLNTAFPNQSKTMNDDNKTNRTDEKQSIKESQNGENSKNESIISKNNIFMTNDDVKLQNFKVIEKKPIINNISSDIYKLYSVSVTPAIKDYQDYDYKDFLNSVNFKITSLQIPYISDRLYEFTIKTTETLLKTNQLYNSTIYSNTFYTINNVQENNEIQEEINSKGKKLWVDFSKLNINFLDFLSHLRITYSKKVVLSVDINFNGNKIAYIFFTIKKDQLDNMNWDQKMGHYSVYFQSKKINFRPNDHGRIRKQLINN